MNVGEYSCAICLNPLDSEQTTDQEETVCGHIYHKHCLRTWLNVQTSCPCCRYTLREPPLITSNPVDWDPDDVCEWYFDDEDDLTDSDDD